MIKPNFKFDDGTRVWFTGCTHAYHKNITKNVSNWSNGGMRDFTDQYVMTYELINNINKYVDENDVIIHNGDVAFGGFHMLCDFMNKIKCKNIYLCLGNHDQHIQQNTSETFKYDRNTRSIFKLKELAPLNSIIELYQARDLFTSVMQTMQIVVEDQWIVCSHYAHLIWHMNNKGGWMIYSHSHGALENHPHVLNNKMMDSGVDNIFNLFGEYRPINYYEIKSILDQKEILTVDHHKFDAK